MLFREEQRFRQAWLWVVMLSQLAVAFAVVMKAMAKPEIVVILAITGVVSALVVALFAFAKLIVEVDRHGVFVTFRPFHRAPVRFALSEIERVVARRYRAIAEYGGWGIRGLGKKRAYNVSGNEGVELFLRDGRQIMLGSQRAAELRAAIEDAKRMV